jgi:hypothetical protein
MLEVFELHVAQSGVPVVTDVILDRCSTAVLALDRSDLAGLVCEDRLVAKCPSWSVNETCAPRCARSRRTITRDPAEQLVRSRWLLISQTSPLGRSAPSW